MTTALLHLNCVAAESSTGRRHWVARRRIDPGTVIAFFSGEIVNTQEMLRRVRRGNGNVDDPLQISRDFYILLDEDSQLFSHSCEPNAGVRGVNTLFALSEIDEGEVVSLDFSTVVGVSLFDQIWEMNCNCGTATCRRFLKSVLSLPRETLKRYAIMGALPDFIMTDLISTESSPLTYKK